MKSTILGGLHYWSTWQVDRRIDFNGFFWSRPEGGVLIDPLPMDAAGAAFAAARGGARWILLTNFDHLRGAAQAKERFGASVLAPAGERARFGPAGALVDGWFERTRDLPVELRESIGVHTLRGGKSPVEAALYLEPIAALVFGDVVRSHVSGHVHLLPDEKLADKAAVMESLRPLAELDVAALLLGDGDCIFRGAAEVWESFFR